METVNLISRILSFIILVLWVVSYFAYKKKQSTWLRYLKIFTTVYVMTYGVLMIIFAVLGWI